MIRRLLLVVVVSLSLWAAVQTPPQPVHAQSVTWQAQFYNNPYLLDPVVVTQNVSIIAFDWGAGAPVANVDADNWSARFTTNTFFQAGTYRFYVQADDAVHLFVDYNNLVIDTFNQNRASQLLTVDVTFSEGNHQIQLDFQELTGNAAVYLSWANLATNPTGPNFGSPSTGTAPTSGACSVQFYNNPLLQGSPSVVTSAGSPNADWGTGAPAAGIGVDNFSARFTCPQTLNGTYQINVKADDGVRVYVDSILYLDEWHAATAQTYTATFTVASGTHTVVVEYFEQAGAAYINFSLNSSSSGGSGGGGIWTAQYYNNPTLAGNPTTVINESDPSHNWGTGSPLNGIGADNFSVRWASTQSLSAGTYRFTVQADDGVRVYVDGANIINQFQAATGQTYTRDVSLAAGPHSLVVEYYEGIGNAVLQYGFARIDSPAPPTNNTGAFAAINTSRLNVRNAPNRFTGAVIAKVSRGETYPVVGRNQDSSWWQINVNGTVGWVSATYVIVSNGQNVVVVSGTNTEVPTPTGFTITTKVRVNMRGAPSFDSTIVGVFTPNSIGQILGRSSDSRWYKISFNDLIGWVSATYVIPQQQLDLNKIPVMST